MTYFSTRLVDGDVRKPFLDLDSERAQFRLNRHWEKGLLNEVMMSIDQSGRVMLYNVYAYSSNLMTNFTT